VGVGQGGAAFSCVIHIEIFGNLPKYIQSHGILDMKAWSNQKVALDMAATLWTPTIQVSLEKGHKTGKRGIFEKIPEET
jgi:hypothetical protein